jgi:hypothetical protein
MGPRRRCRAGARILVGMVAALAALTAAAPSLSAQKERLQEEAAARRARPTRASPLQKPRHIVPADARSQALLAHARNEKRDKSRAGRPRHGQRDDVVVIEDNGSIVTRARAGNVFDIGRPFSIEFTPIADGFAISSSADSPDVYGTEFLDITRPDDSVEVALDFSFPFFGEEHSSVWVNGAGNLTFGAGDTDPFDPFALRDVARFAAGPPRVAPFYADLFPARVAIERFPDRIVFTWDVSDSLVEGLQAVLRADGSFRFAYNAGNIPPFVDVVIGISPGDPAATLQEVDYLESLPVDVARGIVVEAFGATLNAFDLALQTVTFTPVPGGFAMARAPSDGELEYGPALEIGNFGAADVMLPFAFPFGGEHHTRIVVSDDGTIGFGGRCSANADAALGGPPCIFVFAAGLRPDLGGSVHAAVAGGQVVVTWADVPSAADVVTAQAVLHSDGQIVLSYPRPIGRHGTVLVGVAGGEVRAPIREVDFSGELPLTVAAATAIERFGFAIEHVDLTDRTVSFTPEGEGFRIAAGSGGFDDAHHRLSDRIPVGCDGVPACRSAEVLLPFAFPFMGRMHDRLFVNPSGNVTFDRPDPEDNDAARMLGGPPRISPFSILAAASSVTRQFGRVSAFTDHMRAVITWDRIDFEDAFRTEGSGLTVQLVLEADGTIRFVYPSVLYYGVVGIAEGGNAGPIHEIDLTAEHSGPLAAGMIFEDFVTEIPFASVDIVELAREFYADQQDSFDMLVVFTDFPVQLGGFAFNVPISNATLGLGLDSAPTEVFDHTAFFGSSGELESLIMMNNINLYWPDAKRMVDPPIDLVPIRRRLMGIGDGGPLTLANQPWSLTYDSPMSLLAHEVGHRWLAGPSFVHPQTGIGSDSDDLITVSLQHWSPVHHTALPKKQFKGDPRASAMEGSVLLDLEGPLFPQDSQLPDCNAGETAFLRDPLQLFDGYSTLDQYFMGLRAPEEVGPLFYIDRARAVFRPPVPRPPPGEPPPPPSPYHAPACGTRVDLTIDDIIAHPAMGPRSPARGDEHDGRRGDVKTMAFVLLTLGPAHEDALRRVETFRKTFEKYANGDATGGRGRFDTSLRGKGR